MLVDNNVEHLMTLLATPQPWASEAENLERRAMFLRVSERLAEVVREQQNEVMGSGRCPEWLDGLVAACAAGTETIITFNYDTLVESAFTMYEGQKGKHRQAQQLYATPMATLRSRHGYAVLSSGNDEPSFTLLKLHGSVNWFYSGALQSSGEVLYLLEHYRDPAHEDGVWYPQPYTDQLSLAPDKVALVVPPTTDKTTFLSHESVRTQWQRASLDLAHAVNVYFVGYSMPETDLMVRFMLQNARLEPDTQLYVVNKAADDEHAAAVVHAYESLHLPQQWHFDYVHTDEVVPQFAYDFINGQVR